MDTQSFVACLVVVVLIYRVVIVALQRKGDVRAGAKIGPGSFFLEVKDRDSHDKN